MLYRLSILLSKAEQHSSTFIGNLNWWIDFCFISISMFILRKREVTFWNPRPFVTSWCHMLCDLFMGIKYIYFIITLTWLGDLYFFVSLTLGSVHSKYCACTPEMWRVERFYYILSLNLRVLMHYNVTVLERPLKHDKITRSKCSNVRPWLLWRILNLQRILNYRLYMAKLDCFSSPLVQFDNLLAR